MQSTAKQFEFYLYPTELPCGRGTCSIGPLPLGVGVTAGPLGGGTRTLYSGHAARATGQWPQSSGRGDIVKRLTGRVLVVPAAAIQAAAPMPCAFAMTAF